MEPILNKDLYRMNPFKENMKDMHWITPTKLYTKASLFLLEILTFRGLESIDSYIRNK